MLTICRLDVVLSLTFSSHVLPNVWKGAEQEVLHQTSLSCQSNMEEYKAIITITLGLWRCRFKYIKNTWSEKKADPVVLLGEKKLETMNVFQYN